MIASYGPRLRRASRIDHGSTVNIVLRNLQAVVPDVVGDSEADARTALTNAGFVVAVGADIDTNVQGDDNLVSTVSPAVGQQIDHGSTVTISLWNYVAAPVPMALWTATMTGTTQGSLVGLRTTGPARTKARRCPTRWPRTSKTPTATTWT